MRRLRILTWHIHGSYLYYLTQAPHDFYLPVRPGGEPGYGGRAGDFAWGENVHDVPAEDVARGEYDVILFQSRRNWEQDQFEILSEAQRRGPRVYLEHDPPRESPTDTRHVVDDPDVLLVQVTAFNDLMWDAGRTPTRVVEHGVIVPEGARYTGELERGLVVVNNLATRGRRLGLDVFERARAELPLDLTGLGAEVLNGLGPLSLADLHRMEGRYRFFFNPIRYTSLGLAVCEAMMVGMPVVALATTEMATVIENGVNGYADTNVRNLMHRMRELLANPTLAWELGEGARHTALERFGIERFARDWSNVFAAVTVNREFQR